MLYQCCILFFGIDIFKCSRLATETIYRESGSVQILSLAI